MPQIQHVLLVVIVVDGGGRRPGKILRFLFPVVIGPRMMIHSRRQRHGRPKWLVRPPNTSRKKWPSPTTMEHVDHGISKGSSSSSDKDDYTDDVGMTNAMALCALVVVLVVVEDGGALRGCNWGDDKIAAAT